MARPLGSMLRIKLCGYSYVYMMPSFDGLTTLHMSDEYRFYQLDLSSLNNDIIIINIDI